MQMPMGRPATAERTPDLTPVMARLGPADLETLDTLITTGIAANRAAAGQGHTGEAFSLVGTPGSG
jgi:hypothetical protein